LQKWGPAALPLGGRYLFVKKFQVFIAEEPLGGLPTEEGAAGTPAAQGWGGGYLPPPPRLAGPPPPLYIPIFGC